MTSKHLVLIHSLNYANNPKNLDTKYLGKNWQVFPKAFVFAKFRIPYLTLFLHTSNFGARSMRKL